MRADSRPSNLAPWQISAPPGRLAIKSEPWAPASAGFRYPIALTDSFPRHERTRLLPVARVHELVRRCGVVVPLHRHILCHLPARRRVRGLLRPVLVDGVRCIWLGVLRLHRGAAEARALDALGMGGLEEMRIRRGGSRGNHLAHPPFRHLSDPGSTQTPESRSCVWHGWQIRTPRWQVAPILVEIGPRRPLLVTVSTRDGATGTARGEETEAAIHGPGAPQKARGGGGVNSGCNRRFHWREPGRSFRMDDSGAHLGQQRGHAGTNLCLLGNAWFIGNVFPQSVPRLATNVYLFDPLVCLRAPGGREDTCSVRKANNTACALRQNPKVHHGMPCNNKCNISGRRREGPSATC